MSQVLASILVVDDDSAVVDYLLEMLGEEGYRVEGTTSPKAALERIAEGSFDLLICDIEMPEIRGIELLRRVVELQTNVLVILITAFGSIELAVECLRAGAADFVTKPFRIGVLLRAIERALAERRMRREIVRLRSELRERDGSGPLVAESAVMREVLALARKVAATSSSVLLLGESGVGKTALARYIHEQSSRAEGPFMQINCATIPEMVAESELFGVRKGAFTDAREDRVGLFAAAEGGSLLLDEIGELSLAMQAKLLQVLETHEVRPLGSTSSTPIDVRVIAASNRDLQQAVERGEFRADLLFRLDILRIEVPPLRERPEDIEPLTDVLLARICKRLDRPVLAIGDEALRSLRGRPWPGNVRELANLLERAVILSDHDTLMLEDLVVRREPGGSPDQALELAARRGLTLAELENAYIDAVLRVTDGNRTDAAKLLGIDRRTLYRRLE
jgi:DNA-binding NtrC family response regulator